MSSMRAKNLQFKFILRPEKVVMKAPKIFAEGHQSLSYFMNAALRIIRYKVSLRANLSSKTISN